MRLLFASITFLLSVGPASSVAKAQHSTVLLPQSARFTAAYVVKPQAGRMPLHDPQTEQLRLRAAPILRDVAAEIGRIFQLEEDLEVTLKPAAEGFLDKRKGGLSSWASAVYYNGEIHIRIQPGVSWDPAALRRTLRHELVHAATDTLSGRRTPVWLDEGLAQYFEGGSIGARSQTCRQSGPSLESLTDSFGTLSREEAEVSYALSFSAARSLVRRFGMTSIRRFLLALRDPAVGVDRAFVEAFGVRFADFEVDLQLEDSRMPCSG